MPRAKNAQKKPDITPKFFRWVRARGEDEFNALTVAGYQSYSNVAWTQDAEPVPVLMFRKELE